MRVFFLALETPAGVASEGALPTGTSTKRGVVSSLEMLKDRIGWCVCEGTRCARAIVMPTGVEFPCCCVRHHDFLSDGINSYYCIYVRCLQRSSAV